MEERRQLARYLSCVSGSGSKQQRQAQRKRPADTVNAGAVTRSADAALRVDLSDLVFSNRTSQVIVGWEGCQTT